MGGGSVGKAGHWTVCGFCQLAMEVTMPVYTCVCVYIYIYIGADVQGPMPWASLCVLLSVHVCEVMCSQSTQSPSFSVISEADSE